MTPSSLDSRVSSISVLGPIVALLLAVGCSSTEQGTSGTTSTSGGFTSNGGSTANGGITGASGSTANGGNTGNGGTITSGGTTGNGNTVTSDGTTGIGGTVASDGTTGIGGTTANGGTTGIGNTTASGGTTGTGGTTGRGRTSSSTGGVTGSGASGSDGGAASSGGSDAGAADGGTVDCTATLPTGGKTYTGTNVNGSADGLNYGIWTNGSGGSITVFPSAHAFSASWNNSSDFLAHLGLDFNGSKSYTAYGTVVAQFVESKTGSAGGFSSIGIYGWMHSPCVEWYINEDSYTGLRPRGSVMVTIDGAPYYLTTSTTTGTGGANACEAGHTGGWTNITSTRATARQCGTVTVSDHFAAWAKQGWSLGNLASVHINVEVGGGAGSIDFPIANVTTTSK